MVTDFKKKQKTQYSKYLLLVLGAIFICGLMVSLVIANVKMYQRKKELNAQIQNLQEKIAEAKQKNEHLEQGIAEANETAYIEKVAREELDMQKPGESVVSFIPPKTEEAAAVQPQAQNWWDKFLGFLHWGKK